LQMVGALLGLSGPWLAALGRAAIHQFPVVQP
jgi:hypothetical protein